MDVVVDAWPAWAEWASWTVGGLASAGGGWWVWSRLALLSARVEHLEASLEVSAGLSDQVGRLTAEVAELETADQRRSEARALVEPKKDVGASGTAEPAPAPPYEAFP